VGTLLFMRDAKVTLTLTGGAGTPVEYNGQCSTAAVEVEAGDTVTYPVLDGTIPTEIGPSSYALHLVAAQVWDAADGLARFLWDHEGESADFVLQAHGKDVANAATTPAATGVVRLVAGSYGGEVGTYAELDVTLPCATKPTLAEA